MTRTTFEVPADVAALVSSLLIGIVLLAGCTMKRAPAAPHISVVADDGAETTLWANLNGRVTGTPAQLGVQEFPFEVPTAAVAIEVTLAWTSSSADLDVALVDPQGKVVAAGFPESPTRVSTATLEPPARGTWTVRVRAPRALDEPFTVATRILLVHPAYSVVEQTYEINGADASAVKEINFVMEEAASFDWTFTSTTPVHYDIHSHKGGETTYHERGTAAAKDGSFTAPKRQIYSVLFSAPDPGEGMPAPAEVRFRMEGAFRVHSHSQ